MNTIETEKDTELYNKISRPDENTMKNDGDVNLLFNGDVASIETTERYIELR